ncbi:MAG: retropepsin-like aspartic protease family protein [Burkholderiales bacterium]
MLVAAQVYALDVNVVGLTEGKAVVSINGGRARTLKAGETTSEGVKLLSATSEAAVFEINGKRETLTMGQAISANFASSGAQSVTLQSDSRGHFVSSANINGGSVSVLVDTGATLISMNHSDARRLGINYLKGQKGYSQTASGVATVYRVKLDTVKLGDIVLNNVDAAVHEGTGPPIVLLGMSFLSRVEMKREGDRLILTKRF